MSTPHSSEASGSRHRQFAALLRVRRCTYCRQWKDPSKFTCEGDHVIPESMGGTWIDRSVCELCNRQANRISDELIARDFLIRYLRARHRVPDRNNTIPRAPVIALRVSGGGVVNVTLTPTGPTYHASLPPSALERLQLDSLTDQERLSAIVQDALAPLPTSDIDKGRELARRGQPLKTPPDTWSRFMAKLGLACGRDAYGEDWLDTRQAKILSDDLLRGHPPQFHQRWFYPPVEPAWPFEPPQHRLWIHTSQDTVILWIALFGEVIGAVPIGDTPAGEARHTAWSFDPIGGTGEPRVRRSNYEGLYGGTLAARATKLGADVISIPDLGLTYVPDGPNGPIDLGVTLPRVDSLNEAIDYAKRGGGSS